MVELVEECQIPDVACGNILAGPSPRFLGRVMSMPTHPLFPRLAVVGQSYMEPEDDVSDLAVFQVAGLGQDNHVEASPCHKGCGGRFASLLGNVVGGLVPPAD